MNPCCQYNKSMLKVFLILFWRALVDSLKYSSVIEWFVQSPLSRLYLAGITCSFLLKHSSPVFEAPQKSFLNGVACTIESSTDILTTAVDLNLYPTIIYAKSILAIFL